MEMEYEDYEGIIRSLAYGWTNSTGLEADELLSEGNEEFMKCTLKFDESRGVKFSTYLYTSINYHFKGLAIKRYQSIAMNHDTEADVADYVDTEKSLILREWIGALSEESRFIIDVVLDTPSVLLQWALEDKKPKMTKKLLQKYLRSVGWSWSNIWDSFQEITEQIEEL